MASSDKTSENNDAELDDAHVVHYSYYVRNLNILKSFPYERCFTTDCQELSTSWQFKMLFQQVPSAGTVSCSITLRRIDNVKKPVMASVSLSLSRQANGTSFISDNFQKDEIHPGEELQDFIDEVIPIKHMSTTFYEKIDIAVNVIICNCHSMIKKDS